MSRAGFARATLPLPQGPQAMAGYGPMALDEGAEVPQLLFVDRGEGDAEPPILQADGRAIEGVTLPVEGPDGERLLLAVFPAIEGGMPKEIPQARRLRWRGEDLEIVNG